MMNIDSIELLKKTNMIKIDKEHLIAAQAQQNSLIKDKINTENLKSQAKYYPPSQKDIYFSRSLIPNLCISKKEYELIVKNRPLIKFRPLRNTYIKSCDKSLLAESLNVPVFDVDTVINETIDYLLYRNPDSLYYDTEKQIDITYTKKIFNQLMLKQDITQKEDIQKQELLFYSQPVAIMGDYIYRHGSKNQLLNYMKLQLSDAKSVLEQLYNILNTECRGLYSYFERPIHILDNRSILKMEKIIKNGLGEAHKKGYIKSDTYSQNVQWALDRIYQIQSDTSLREAFRIVASNR